MAQSNSKTKLSHVFRLYYLLQELELELIQTHMTQKPMRRVEVGGIISYKSTFPSPGLSRRAPKASRKRRASFAQVKIFGFTESKQKFNQQQVQNPKFLSLSALIIAPLIVLWYSLIPKHCFAVFSGFRPRKVSFSTEPS